MSIDACVFVTPFIVGDLFCFNVSQHVARPGCSSVANNCVAQSVCDALTMSVVDGLPFAEEKKEYVLQILDPILEEMVSDLAKWKAFLPNPSSQNKRCIRSVVAQSSAGMQRACLT